MSVILGVFYHFIGGFCSGTFYLPYKRVRQWSWETYWLVGGLFSWLFIPWIVAMLTVPGCQQIIADTSPTTLFWTYVMGLLWGIGGLTFGLTMRYLGLSLGVSVALCLNAALGALIPPIYRDIAGIDGYRFSAMLISSGGQMVLVGVLICLLGIAVCGRAGMRKEREGINSRRQMAIQEFNLRLGLVVAIVCGIFSACFNFGIEAGQPMARLAVERGGNPLFQNNVVFVVLLWGGLTTNVIWCMILNFRKRSFGDYADRKTPLVNNYLFAAIAGTVWFLQFFFYGMGASYLSNGPSSWVLHMAFIIIVGNVWGIALMEWRGVTKRTFNMVLSGIAIILLAVGCVGYGNSLLAH